MIREKENEKTKGIEKNEKTKRGIEKYFLKFPTTFVLLFIWKTFLMRWFSANYLQ
ncbi:hypothetical protein [Methanosarcina acetivorans]|uniref:hypothetical protein n=1 Tax=Methanosarcina acetivorans TaxID=2214 RepID=UPI000AAC1058|nr:hypothetical protein [Methanosarcina acetivorans]